MHCSIPRSVRCRVKLAQMSPGERLIIPLRGYARVDEVAFQMPWRTEFSESSGVDWLYSLLIGPDFTSRPFCIHSVYYTVPVSPRASARRSFRCSSARPLSGRNRFLPAGRSPGRMAKLPDDISLVSRPRPAPRYRLDTPPAPIPGSQRSSITSAASSRGHPARAGTPLFTVDLQFPTARTHLSAGASASASGSDVEVMSCTPSAGDRTSSIRSAHPR